MTSRAIEREEATKLVYAIQPEQVFVATTTTLTLTITNPLSSPPLTFQGGRGGDEIDVFVAAGGAATDLTTALDFTPRCLTDGFTFAASQSGDYYVVAASGFGEQLLLPGQTIVVQLDQLTVNPVEGASVVRIEELIGDGDGIARVSVGKIPQKLAVIAWPRDWVVGLGQPTTLLWQSFGGTLVAVYGFADNALDPNCPPAQRKPGQRCFPVEGPPPSAGNTIVTVPPDEGQWTYTVEVFTSDGQHAQTDVTLTQHAPVVTGFGLAPHYAQPEHPVGAMDTVELVWRTMFAARAYLTTPAAVQPVRVQPNPTGTYPVSPGRDVTRGWVAGSPVPGSATYGLNATGYGAPSDASLTFDIAPLEIAYFKFAHMATDGTLSGITWATDPPDWIALAVQINEQPYTLTLYQPGGGTTVRYLGSGDTTHAQVQYFEATPGEGGAFTLTWVTANTKTLVLDPLGYDVPANDIAKGTHSVHPDGPTTYVLRATAQDGQVVTSSLVVTPG